MTGGRHPPWVELRASSAFRFLEAASLPEDLATRAAELGQPALALADLGARLFFRLAHTEPPTGMITALVGAPLFLWLLASRTRRSER